MDKQNIGKGTPTTAKQQLPQSVSDRGNSNQQQSQSPQRPLYPPHPARGRVDDLYQGGLPDDTLRIQDPTTLQTRLDSIYQRDFPDYLPDKIYNHGIEIDLNKKATNGVAAQMAAHLEVWTSPCLLRLTDIFKKIKNFKDSVAMDWLEDYNNACLSRGLIGCRRYYTVSTRHEEYNRNCTCLFCKACIETGEKISKFGVNVDMMWRILISTVAGRIHNIISSKSLLAFQQEAYRIDLDDKIAYGLQNAVPPLVAMKFEEFFKCMTKLALDVAGLFLQRFNSILKAGTNNYTTCLNFVTCFIDMTLCYHETLEGLKKHLIGFDYRLEQEGCGELDFKFLFLYFYFQYVYRTREMNLALVHCEQTMQDAYRTTKSKTRRQFILNLQYDLLRIDLMLQNVGNVWHEKTLPFKYNEPRIPTWNLFKMSQIRNPFKPFDRAQPEVYQVYHSSESGQWEHRKLERCSMSGLFLADPILDICLSLPSDRSKRVDCRLYRQELIANPSEAGCAVQRGDFSFLRSHDIDVYYKSSSFFKNVYQPQRDHLLLDEVEGDLEWPEEVVDFDMTKMAAYRSKSKKRRSIRDNFAYTKSGKVAKLYIRRVKYCKYPLDPRLKHRRNRFILQEIIPSNRICGVRNMKQARQSSDLAKLLDLVLQAGSDILIPQAADRNDERRYKYYVGITNLAESKHLEELENECNLDMSKTSPPNVAKRILYEHYDSLWAKRQIEYDNEGGWITPHLMEREWIKSRIQQVQRPETGDEDSPTEDEEETARQTSSQKSSFQSNAMEHLDKFELKLQISNTKGIEGRVVSETKIRNTNTSSEIITKDKSKEGNAMRKPKLDDKHTNIKCIVEDKPNNTVVNESPKFPTKDEIQKSLKNSKKHPVMVPNPAHPSFARQHKCCGDHDHLPSPPPAPELSLKLRVDANGRLTKIPDDDPCEKYEGFAEYALGNDGQYHKTNGIGPDRIPVPEAQAATLAPHRNPNDANRLKNELFAPKGCGQHGKGRPMYPDTDGCKCCHFKLKRENRIRGIPVNTGYARTRQHLREKLKREKIEAQNEKAAEAKTHESQNQKPTEIPLPTDDVDELVSLIEGTNLSRSDKSNGVADQRKVAKKARQRERKEQLRLEEEAQRKAEEERLRRLEEEERLKREAEAREEELRLKKEKKKRRRKNKKAGIVDENEETNGSDSKENSKTSKVETPCFAPTSSSGLPLSQNATRKCDMVTIRRHPTTPDTTVTITCQSESGGEILLRTLVNGQEVSTENSKTDKRVGSHGQNQTVGSKNGSTNKAPQPEPVDNSKSEINSKKKNKKKNKKGNQVQKTDSSSEDKRDSSGKENGVVIIENTGRSVNSASAASGSHHNYSHSIVSSGAPQSPLPFVKGTSCSSTALVGSSRPEDRKSFSYFSGLEGDEIDLSKLKLPPGITITKVNQPVKDQGSDESSEEEDDGSFGIPPPGVGLYNQDSNMIVMNPDNNDDDIDLAGYTSDDFLLGRVQCAEFEEVVSSKTKKLRSKAHRNDGDGDMGQKPKPKVVLTQAGKPKRSDQNGKATFDRTKKPHAKNGANANKPPGKHSTKVFGENSGVQPNRLIGRNIGTRIIKPSHETIFIHSKDESETSFTQIHRPATVPSPHHQHGFPIVKPNRLTTASIPNAQTHIPATSLVFNNSKLISSENPPPVQFPRPLSRPEPATHAPSTNHGSSSQNPLNSSYCPFNSKFDLCMGATGKKEAQPFAPPNPINNQNHGVFPNASLPRLSPGEIDNHQNQGFNWNTNSFHKDFQSAVTRPSRPTSRQGPLLDIDPSHAYGARPEPSISGSSLRDGWWDPQQQSHPTLSRFFDGDYGATTTAAEVNPFNRPSTFGSVLPIRNTPTTFTQHLEDYSAFGLDRRAQNLVQPTANSFLADEPRRVANGFIPEESRRAANGFLSDETRRNGNGYHNEETRRASLDGIYPNVSHHNINEHPALNSFIASLSNRMASTAPGTFPHSENVYRPPGPIGTPIQPRTNQGYEHRDFNPTANQDSNTQYSLFGDYFRNTANLK